MPLRSGSQSIPFKNIKELAGKPLFAWSLSAAIESNCFDSILVATDSRDIGNLVKDWFDTDVEVVSRTAQSATSKAPTETVMMEILKQRAFDVICLVQATSPLTKACHFMEAKKAFEQNSLDSLFTGVLRKSFYWTAQNDPLNYSPEDRPRRQDFTGVIQENGAFYYTKRNVLEAKNSRLGGKIGHYLMPEESAVEIDEPEDFEFVEQMLGKSTLKP